MKYSDFIQLIKEGHAQARPYRYKIKEVFEPDEDVVEETAKEEDSNDELLLDEEDNTSCGDKPVQESLKIKISKQELRKIIKEHVLKHRK